MTVVLAAATVVSAAVGIYFWVRSDMFDGSNAMRSRGARLYGIAICVAAAVLSLAALAAGAGS
jgi:hypothetical protein